MVTTPHFEPLQDLTEAESAAVRTYASDSRRMHHLMQGRDASDCEALGTRVFGELNERLAAIGELLPHIDAATRKYRLKQDATLFAGFANGYAALGGLWHSEPKQLVGLVFEYGGFFSTSANESAAREYLERGSKFNSVFLTIHARAGLRGRPLWVIDRDHAFEGEVLVAKATRFTIVCAAREVTEGGTSYVGLELQEPARP
jgi:hypothetical protein